MPTRYLLFVILTLSLTAAVGFATYRTSQLLKVWKPDRNLLLLPSENLVRTVLVTISVALGLLSGLGYEQLGWIFEQWQSELLEGTVWGLAMAVGFFAATRWISLATGERYYSTLVVDAILPRNKREAIGIVFAMIGVVLAEELLFRSLLLGGLEPILPQLALLLVTSALFGFFHLPQGAWGVTGAAIAGGLLGLLFIRTGSIVAPIAAHYVTNMVQIWVAMRLYRRDSRTDQKDNLSSLDR